MPGACALEERVCATKPCLLVCPASHSNPTDAEGDLSRPGKGALGTPPAAPPRPQDAVPNTQPCAPCGLPKKQAQARTNRKHNMTDREGGTAGRAKVDDSSESSNQNNIGSPAWLTISTQDQMACDECCGMPIRSDTPIAELAREWIRFRNAEDTGVWAPCPGEGVYPESPSMLRFVHYMRSQYTGGCGMVGLDVCSEICDQKSHNAKQDSNACPPSCPVVSGKSGRSGSPGDTGILRQSLKPGSPGGGGCPPCEAAANLSTVHEEQERVGEIVEGLRRAVQNQSNGRNCPPCCQPPSCPPCGPPSSCPPCCAPSSSPPPNCPPCCPKKNKQRSQSPYHRFDPRLCGPQCHLDDELPGYGDDGFAPRCCCSRYWVDDETKPSYNPPPKVTRVRSSSQCNPCGGSVRPPNGANRCPGAGCPPSPVAVFNFNECAATFQQHLHAQDDCPGECANVEQ